MFLRTYEYVMNILVYYIPTITIDRQGKKKQPAGATIFREKNYAESVANSINLVSDTDFDWYNAFCNEIHFVSWNANIEPASPPNRLLISLVMI